MVKKTIKERTYISDIDNIERVMRLRYGVSDPNDQQTAVFSTTCVAIYLKVSISIVRRIERTYFKNYSK